MHLETEIERDWTSSWRRSMDGAPSIHQLLNLKQWECDKVTIHFSSHGDLADGSRLCREARRKLKLHSGVNSK